MRRDMGPDDNVTVTLGGVTHEFGPDRARISVVQTSTRDGEKYRYATLVIRLDDEFPEDLTEHLTRMREG